MHPDEDEDEIDGPSAEDIYIDLESEMAKIVPYTCPTKVRVLLAKVAFKVHKEKDPGKLWPNLQKAVKIGPKPFFSKEHIFVKNQDLAIWEFCWKLF